MFILNIIKLERYWSFIHLSCKCICIKDE